jgi:hypothetical protein
MYGARRPPMRKTAFTFQIMAVFLCVLPLLFAGCGTRESSDRVADRVDDSNWRERERMADDGASNTFLKRNITKELGERLKAALVQHAEENPEDSELISKTIEPVELTKDGRLWIGGWVAHPEDERLRLAEPPAQVYRTYIAKISYSPDTDRFHVEYITCMEKRSKKSGR